MKYKAYLYGVPCVYDEEEFKITGTGKINNFMLNTMARIFNLISEINKYFTGEYLDMRIKIKND